MKTYAGDYSDGGISFYPVAVAEDAYCSTLVSNVPWYVHIYFLFTAKLFNHAESLVHRRSRRVHPLDESEA